MLRLWFIGERERERERERVYLSIDNRIDLSTNWGEEEVAT